MNLHDAIFKLNSNIVTMRNDVAYDKDDNIVSYDKAAAESLVAANEYRVSRSAEYPALSDQLDMLWHAIDSGTLDKTSDFYTTLKAVKTKYPKS